MSIIIRASDTGFHMQSASGKRLPVPLFFQTHWTADAKFTKIDSHGIWQADDLQPLTVTLITDTFLPPAVIGDQSYIKFSGAEISQSFANGPHPIASLEFGTEIEALARYDEHGVQSQTGWQIELTDLYQNHVQDFGLVFIGGDGIDLFQPDYEPAYYTHVTRIRLGGGNDTAHGTRGDDRIHGGDGDDELSDDYGQNFLTGKTGDDTITLGNNSDGSSARGGEGNDLLVSGHGDDSLFGNQGADELRGNNGADFLKGGGGEDTLFGGAGDDILLGGGQADILRGGRGDDTLTGNSGADIFIFYQNTDGHDTITDFGRGRDVIALDDYIGEFEDLILVQSGTDTIITIPDESFSIRLENLQISALSADDFLFAS